MSNVDLQSANHASRGNPSGDDALLLGVTAANANEINAGHSQLSADSSENTGTLQLHQLCQEARGPDDIAWRNALYLLRMQPEMAQVLDSQGRTPLHVACMGQPAAAEPQQRPPLPRPPPDYILRALLLANPEAIQQTDADARLPIHCMAAASGDAQGMQLLMEANPSSMVARDSMGWTPLLLFLQNPHVQVAVPPIQVLMGMTLPVQSAPQTRSSIRQRGGDHLKLKVEHLDRMHTGGKRPREQSKLPVGISDKVMKAYPEDVRLCLSQLEKWSRKQGRQQQDNKEAHDVSFLTSTSFSSSFQQQERNPAAIFAPQDRRLPLHLLILRGLSDIHLQSSRVEEVNRDGGGGGTQQHTLIVVVRLLIAAYPEGLIARDTNGHTPLLLAMVAASDVLPSQELLELLLGKRTAGYDSMPLWAQDVPYPVQHAYAPFRQRTLAPAAERYCNPAIVSTLDTCQLPLHIAAEEWSDHSSLLVAIYESYPGAMHVQDARGRMPLHILLQNYRRITPHPEIVAMLLSERAAKTMDDEGQLPFDLLVNAASCLPKDPIPCSMLPTGTVVHPDPYKAFQYFFQPAILTSAARGEGRRDGTREQRRAEAEVFLWRLRTLPPWLRRQACGASFVQELLLEELASPAKCAFVMMQGLLWGLLMAAFRRQMDIFSDTAAASGFSPTAVDSLPIFDGSEEQILTRGIFAEQSPRYEAWNTLAVYGLCAVAIGIQAVFWALSGTLGEFQHLCLFSVWRWVDLLAIICTSMTAVMIQAELPDDAVLVVSTAATGMLWFAIVGFLSHWWYGMAFFSGLLVKVRREEQLSGSEHSASFSYDNGDSDLEGDSLASRLGSRMRGWFRRNVLHCGASGLLSGSRRDPDLQLARLVPLGVLFGGGRTGCRHGESATSGSWYDRLTPALRGDSFTSFARHRCCSFDSCSQM